MKRLLQEFQQLFREHSGIWLERFSYRETGPQLLLQAFLQRIVNGGGRITREYGLGKGRTDLFILWALPDGSVQRFVEECKIIRGSRESIIRKGIEHVSRYADLCGAREVYLLIFDQKEGMSWEEKIFSKEIDHERKQIIVFGM